MSLRPARFANAGPTRLRKPLIKGLEVLHLSDMPEEAKQNGGLNLSNGRASVLLWLSGAWTLPLLAITLWVLPAAPAMRTALALLGILAAPVPALVLMIRQRRCLVTRVAKAEENAAQLKLQLDTVRYRTTRLREELQAADRQARLKPPADPSWPIHGRFHARVQ